MLSTRLNNYQEFRGRYPELASVIDYNQNTGDMTLYTETGRQIYHPMILSPYFSRGTLDGFFFVPRLNDTLLVDYTANNVPIILGATSAYTRQNQLVSAMNSLKLSPGDYGFIISPSSNGLASGGLIFRNSGAILLQSNPFTSLYFSPSVNTVFANFNSFHLTTLLGDIKILQDEFGGSIEFDLQDVTDAVPAGNIYSFNLLNSTEMPLYSSTISRLGEIDVVVGANLVSLQIDTSGNTNIKSQSMINVSAQSLISMSAQMVNLGSQSASDPAVLGNELQQTLNDVVQALNDILITLNSLMTAASGVTICSPIAGAMAPGIAQITADIAKVTSDIVTINSKIVFLT
jgi:hypothetical protein